MASTLPAAAVARAEPPDRAVVPGGGGPAPLRPGPRAGADEPRGPTVVRNVVLACFLI